HFQPQPAGLGLFFRPTALEMNYVEQLHRIISALLDGKIASSSGGSERSTSPSMRFIKQFQSTPHRV
ncbi:hypothetical protein, partial [Methylophaga sp.]|uniref:hypothetical protein n=1 Tax=Methylophaga sp. TaxID=2024840 RepID=UPI000C98D49A